MVLSEVLRQRFYSSKPFLYARSQLEKKITHLFKDFNVEYLHLTPLEQGILFYRTLEQLLSKSNLEYKSGVNYNGLEKINIFFEKETGRFVGFTDNPSENFHSFISAYELTEVGVTRFREKNTIGLTLE